MCKVCSKSGTNSIYYESCFLTFMLELKDIGTNFVQSGENSAFIIPIIKYILVMRPDAVSIQSSGNVIISTTSEVR